MAIVIHTDVCGSASLPTPKGVVSTLVRTEKHLSEEGDWLKGKERDKIIRIRGKKKYV